ncbi:nucleotidyltransferase family protein [Gordonia sputi]|uniref:nucleotidyltransferase family protein n=2 Tax=Gordonia sputi TaxID=36823 RepID=UPI0036B3CA55
MGRVTGPQMSDHSVRLLDFLAGHREQVRELARARGADNIRVCGSVAAGAAQDDSDIDLLVDFPGQSAGEQIMNAGGLSVELSEALGVEVDVLVLEFAQANVAESISQGRTVQLTHHDLAIAKKRYAQARDIAQHRTNKENHERLG